MAVTTERTPDPALLLEGDGQTRGRGHGEALREEIRLALDRWDEDAAVRTGVLADRYVDELLAATRFVEAMQRHTPDLLAEVRGIADGAGVEFERVLVANLMDEEWWYSTTRGDRQSCSQVAVAGRRDRPALLAQNMDLPRVMDGSQVTLRLRRPDGHETLVLSAAGMIGLTGANSAGLGVCVNALSMLHHSASGLPVAFVIRGLLDRRSLATAERFLRTVPHASGQHYALATAKAIGGWECSAGGAVRSSGNSHRFWHTNHPLASSDVDPAIRSDPALTADSHTRQELLDRRAETVRSIDDCQRLLADRTAPLCIPADRDRDWCTFGSVAMELGRGSRVRVAMGAPDRTAFREHTLAHS